MHIIHWEKTWAFSRNNSFNPIMKLIFCAEINTFGQTQCVFCNIDLLDGNIYLKFDVIWWYGKNKK